MRLNLLTICQRVHYYLKYSRLSRPPDVTNMILKTICGRLTSVHISIGQSNSLSVTLVRTNMTSGFIVYGGKTRSVNATSPVGSPGFHIIMSRILGRPERLSYSLYVT